MSTITTAIAHQKDERERTRVWYDCDRTESISEAVLSAASEHADCDTSELPPLSSYTDIDALNTLFGDNSPGAPSLSGATLEFSYGALVVTVDSAGLIEIQNKSRL
ncbi:hypothetical protein E6P09_00515 [Haloferax mediterranei ATCC 33500]|uniref:Halobacterial output domain-containing protein n=1 Tax=Haloferax mediterranei (strain ATCC 33500 / DSM 1411 / JCM 8866 / NBRC 14739 / NCIMB 2177 / R-4) TaxID=523841 RepID=I3R6R3_HALMT|nr:HalOD1 output domain-containing protein [Haloferax mediterranei]AFK19923.1 hypothetical protein HFX_2235 [Haloferax mediterranei ATCC 33500]AHZ23302.1 hypothetical protein BM92_11920 [Haloferax mediterranei ATCC 33500]ELZ99468.1 hypothetical protein C439_12979 [Haloferax mediterranei ATCC 33500]MDX5987327.1 HalOD1 output domain-containing protein [Haloferax mediterranei ATCC 33500]QCQ73842.1 hypothetical protein E6P09_00515 [Haloferax mediterranei ATCC 33500]